MPHSIPLKFWNNWFLMPNMLHQNCSSIPTAREVFVDMNSRSDISAKDFRKTNRSVEKKNSPKKKQ